MKSAIKEYFMIRKMNKALKRIRKETKALIRIEELRIKLSENDEEVAD